MLAYKIANSVTNFENKSQWNSNFITNDEICCLSVGRLVHVKQFDHYVKVASILRRENKRLKFHLVGSGPLCNSLKNLIKSYDLNDFFFISEATNEIDSYYSRSSIYVVTSSSEAFPMTVLEALSFGLPVISYDMLDGPSELISNNFNGFLCRQDSPESIAEKILYLLDNPNKLLIMRQNSINSVEKFKSTRVIGQWIDIIRNVNN